MAGLDRPFYYIAISMMYEFVVLFGMARQQTQALRYSRWLPHFPTHIMAA